jgi:hypothetical protein
MKWQKGIAIQLCMGALWLAPSFPTQAAGEEDEQDRRACTNQLGQI